MDKDREITVIFCVGDTGTGKTTFSKQMAKLQNKSICISSSSNDVMQDYKGEDILVLDDLRDDNFSFTDLLKLLDNHTKSTTKSRYSNKGFIGDTIIITSYKDIIKWYPSLDDEKKTQLYRRIQFRYVFTKKEIISTTWDSDLERYTLDGSIENIYCIDVKKRVKRGMDLLKNMGAITDEQYNKATEQVEFMNREQLEFVMNDEDPFAK